MPAILDPFIEFLNTNFFGMSFGLIISVILFLIDRQEKRRQEETLRRQDESLDIILDQVSKVNAFQTRSLSLAIESLGKDFENFKKDIDSIKNSLDSPEVFSKDPYSFPEAQEVLSDSSQTNKQIIPTLSAKFGQILSTQVESFIDQIRSNISELSKSEQNKQKNLYKVKKGLEFDIKDLFNIQSMLNDLKKENKSLKSDYDDNISSDNKNSVESKSSQSDVTPQNDPITEKPEEDKISYQIKIDDIDDQLKQLTTIPEIVKFTESFIKKFENLNDNTKQPNSSSNTSSLNKKRVKPTKTISTKDLEDEK